MQKPPGDAESSDSHLGRMARGGGINVIGAVTNQVSLLLITGLIARVLGGRELGHYALCYALLSLLGLLSLCGFRSALTRFVAIHLADDDAPRLRGTVRLGMGLSIGSSLLLGAALFAAAAPVAGLFHDPGLVTGLRLTALTLPAATFTDAALAATQGWRTQRPFTLIGRVYEPGTRLVLTVVALLAGTGLTGAFWALVAAGWSASALAAVALLRRVRRIPAAAPVYDIRPIFSFSMVSWVSTLAATGLIWADTLLLGAMTTSGQVGVYNVATRLVTLAVFVMAPINATFAPHIAHLHHTGEEGELNRIYQAASGWIVRLSLPAFVVLVVLPSNLLGLFGHDFRGAAAVTIVLAAGQLVNAATGPCGTVLNMAGKVRLNMADNVAVLVLNVALNLWLIPAHGILGAAVAWSCSLATVNVLRVLQVRHAVGASPFGREVGKALLAGAASAGAAVLVRALAPAPLELPLGVVAVVAVYAAGVLLLGVSADDRVALASVLHRGRRTPTEAAVAAR